MKTIVYINGIGRIENAHNFSVKMQETLGMWEYNHMEFSFQEEMEKISDKYLEDAFEEPPSWKWKKKTTWRMRRIVMDYAEDALMWPHMKDSIINRLYEEIKNKNEIIFITHSMGCTIANEYMERYGSDKISKFIALGCNIPLFQLSRDKPFVADVDLYNYMEPNDVLSMPLIPLAKHMEQKEAIKVIENVKDIVFNSNHLFKSWNVTSHGSYWRSSKLAKEIKKVLAS